MKICPKCHKEFSNEQGFCGNCGVKLEMKPRFCTKCGNVIEDNQKFCGKCGAKIVSDDVEILKENLSEAALTMGTNVRSILSDEMVNTAKNQMVTIFSKENTAKLKEKAKNTMRKSGKSFSFDLVKMFPKSDEQYSAYYKYLVGNTLLIFVTAIINAIYDNLMTRFLAFIPEILSWYVLIYIIFRAGILKTLIRIICGGLISLLLMFVLFPLTSGAVVPIIVVLSIYVNRQRLRFIRQYFHYIWKPILYVIIALVVSVILSVGVVVSIKDTNVAGTCIIAILTCSFLWASCAFLKGEQEKGIPFLYCQKLLFVVPIMSILFLFSFATAYHVFDPMVDTSDLLTEDMLSAHTTDYGNQQIDEINVEDSFRVASSDAANVQALHQMAEPVPHDFSVTSTSFNFTPVDGMSHVSTPNGFDIQDSDGHTLLTVNNVAGTVQDGHGNYIAHIQDDKLVDMHTGDMIVWHDKVSGIYRSGLSQIININNYGEGVFQSIKDIHGNGIEVINDEVFDAKTHERIGNIRQV